MKLFFSRPSSRAYQWAAVLIVFSTLLLGCTNTKNTNRPTDNNWTDLTDDIHVYPDESGISLYNSQSDCTYALDDDGNLLILGKSSSALVICEESEVIDVRHSTKQHKETIRRRTAQITDDSSN